MTADRNLERAAERFADTVHADVSAQVRLAWALERDRLYAEIAELRDAVLSLSQTLDRHLLSHLAELHSVKVPGDDPGLCGHGVSFAPGVADEGRSQWCGECFPP